MRSLTPARSGPPPPDLPPRPTRSRWTAARTGPARAAPPPPPPPFRPREKKDAARGRRPASLDEDDPDDALLRRANFDLELTLLLALPFSAVAIPILIRNPWVAAIGALALATIPGAPETAARLLAEGAVLLTPGGARSAGRRRLRRRDGEAVIDPRRRKGPPPGE